MSNCDRMPLRASHLASAGSREAVPAVGLAAGGCSSQGRLLEEAGPGRRTAGGAQRRRGRGGQRRRPGPRRDQGSDSPGGGQVVLRPSALVRAQLCAAGCVTLGRRPGVSGPWFYYPQRTPFGVRVEQADTCMKTVKESDARVPPSEVRAWCRRPVRPGRRHCSPRARSLTQ